MLSENTVLKNPMVKVEDNRIYLDSLYKNFENAFQGILNEKKQSLALNASKLDALSPLSSLQRGFSVTKDTAGKVVKSVGQISDGDEITVLVSDGSLLADVKKIEKN